MKKVNEPENTTTTKTSLDIPIIIKAISFFLLMGSSLALLFYFYVLVFNSGLLTDKISTINSTLINPIGYIITESVFFVLLFIGAILLLKLKKIGVFIVSAGMLAILIMNIALTTKIDWLNISVVFVVLLAFIFLHKKFR